MFHNHSGGLELQISILVSQKTEESKMGIWDQGNWDI